jgi:hypothetical protein
VFIAIACNKLFKKGEKGKRKVEGGGMGTFEKSILFFVIFEAFFLGL